MSIDDEWLYSDNMASPSVTVAQNLKPSPSVHNTTLLKNPLTYPSHCLPDSWLQTETALPCVDRRAQSTSTLSSHVDVVWADITHFRGAPFAAELILPLYWKYTESHLCSYLPADYSTPHPRAPILPHLTTTAAYHLPSATNSTRRVHNHLKLNTSSHTIGWRSLAIFYRFFPVSLARPFIPSSLALSERHTHTLLHCRFEGVTPWFKVRVNVLFIEWYLQRVDVVQ